MTKQRLSELDRMVSSAISDCQQYGLADDQVVGFWRGVRMIVDELKRDKGMPDEKSVVYECGNKNYSNKNKKEEL